MTLLDEVAHRGARVFCRAGATGLNRAAAAISAVVSQQQVRTGLMEERALSGWNPRLGIQNISIPVEVEDYLGGLFLGGNPPGVYLSRAVHWDMQVFKGKIQASELSGHSSSGQGK